MSQTQVERTIQVGYDAVVVGSGYGGSIAAYRLAEAGIRVCILEKGRRWEPHQFPATPWKLLSSTRFLTPFGSIGKKDALYEVHSHGDSVALVGSGLGGGSLVNAGIIVPTPKRARMHPNWPSEWQEDWDLYEAKSHSILEPEEILHEAPKSKVLDKIANEIEDAARDSMKLTISFNQKKNAAGVTQNECISCGNCLSGCRYNAKSSTDKNYLELAAQAGARICTQTEVMFITENSEEFCCQPCNDGANCKSVATRRWRVHLNEVDYISADYIIVAAGVLGTNGILLRSKERGLQLSQQLGYGVSCNGNNIAYITGTAAQTQAQGLREEDFSRTPMQLRPGPVISSSHTSSLGFTIQGSCIPQAAPEFLLRGVITYGLGDYGFLTGIWEQVKQWTGTQNSQALVLNMMGYDAADGQIKLDKVTGRVAYSAAKDLLFHHKLRTAEKLAARLRGKLYMSRFRSAAVHLLGGCNAATDSSTGVANANGQIFFPETSNGQFRKTTKVHAGLYVCDASLIPCSVGLNPVSTISIVAERVANGIVNDAQNYLSQKFQHKVFTGDLSNLKSRTYLNSRLASEMQCSYVIIHEKLKGNIGGAPCTLRLVMHMGQDKDTPASNRLFGDSHPLLRGYVGGDVLIPSLEPGPLYVVDGYVNMCHVDGKTPFTQYMHYHLLLSTNTGTRYTLDGRKEMRPFMSGLKCFYESTTLHVVVRTQQESSKPVVLKGKLRVTLPELLKSLISLRGPRKREFVGRLMETLARTYLMRTPRTPTEKVTRKQNLTNNYPNYVLHELVTEDGVHITCKQWCSKDAAESHNSRVVLLLNGYSTESFCLPTESNDIIRTLIQNDYEPWLLQTRLHPLHPAKYSFTFDDIAHFDIPSAFAKINQVKKKQIAAHVIAHCIGGLSIHMSLMGGHIPPSSIASLVCTNSSMFFNLVPSALVKLTLPLIPISMKILGKNTIVPISPPKEESMPWRHRLLRSIARAIPRTESCPCDECNVFSGIFGSTFWHQNVGLEMHDWLNKKAVPVLPMAGFPHLRSIALAGHIVDSEGEEETYMAHPERLAVHTTYISGGRPILVTPETSLRAHGFMKRHHPGFSHARVVIPDYGHSDLWIGEHSHEDVFPLVLERLKSAERSDPSDNLQKNAILPWEEPLAGHKKAAGRSAVAILMALLAIAMLCLLALINPSSRI
ncbi:uncharacterized protein LOC112345107 [Selaginella moellendorffii]|uniref:uncharacterized protein LOC112345107 n=1 Tax=Selaginella moellendorffii TaxID=88036 RepID=UPI000D1C8E7C|nr:uncharacterized protein LOC112345107 [Selaginella moellendorffii]|eukprot:XP_024526945.1 uncharacterized protein LOC112345107 [Selaginella moellendorffii]